MEYARRWAAEHGLALDESLSLRDEGLSAYHQRHVKVGALGVFLRAVEDGLIEAGSVLIVEGLDRLSRAEPLKAQAQLTQIIHAGLTVVTAADGQEYSLEAIRENPYKLIHSLVVMIRAHEESDTKSKRVKAAIRRQCEGWIAGTWRGVIRNGKDPHWVRWNGTGWELTPERAEALRYAVRRFLDGLGGIQIVREMAAHGMQLTDDGRLGSPHLYKTLRKRLLIGEREMTLDGETYALPGYYPALLTEDEFNRLQLALARRVGKRGVGQIPNILTGMGLAVCGHCGGAMVSINSLKGRKLKPNGQPWPGVLRIGCTSHQRGAGCAVIGTIQALPIERALMLYCCDSMKMNELMSGGDQGQALRSDLAAARKRFAETEAKLERLARMLAEDDEPTPITVLRQIRELEATAEQDKQGIEKLERELASLKPTPAAPDLADRWLALLDGVENLDVDARMEARELVRASFARITLWHHGKDSRVVDMEITARGGGSTKLRIDKASGLLLD